jgi:hypothetical protein
MGDKNMKAGHGRAGKTAARLVLATALACGVAAAQGPPPPGPGGPGGNVFFFREAGFAAGFADKVVTSAPYSATISTQTSQTLADGNQINRTSSGTVARDSQGRTRREITLEALGPLADTGKAPPHFVLINDVVAGSSYVLHPDSKTADQLPARGPIKGRGGRGRQGGRLGNPNVVTTQLGTQTIGGVLAEGTRYTRTIPAGAIGNEKPIVIVSERWYSSDLQTEVMTKLSDPRIGETTYTLGNIQRNEPDATLFQVPTDFTITKGPRGRRGGPGAAATTTP